MKCDELKSMTAVEAYEEYENNALDESKHYYYNKQDVDKAIAELKRENEQIKKFNEELVKDCKWLYTNHTPAINGFETIVLCSNGKKRVASFRKFDLRWYDVNNGAKLNVFKWLWQPKMPGE